MKRTINGWDLKAEYGTCGIINSGRGLVNTLTAASTHVICSPSKVNLLRKSDWIKSTKASRSNPILKRLAALKTDPISHFNPKSLF